MSLAHPLLQVRSRHFVFQARGLCGLAVCLASTGPLSRPCAGQEVRPSRLQGKVVTESEVPLPGAEITILDISRTVDGSLQYFFGTQKRDDRLERVHPSRVEMVAVYRDPAEMPAEAAMFVNNDCAIMIWTR